MMRKHTHVTLGPGFVENNRTTHINAWDGKGRACSLRAGQEASKHTKCDIKNDAFFGRRRKESRRRAIVAKERKGLGGRRRREGSVCRGTGDTAVVVSLGDCRGHGARMRLPPARPCNRAKTQEAATAAGTGVTLTQKRRGERCGDGSKTPH